MTRLSQSEKIGLVFRQSQTIREGRAESQDLAGEIYELLAYSRVAGVNEPLGFIIRTWRHEMITGVKLGSNIVKLGSNISDIPNLVLIGDLGDGKKVYRMEGKRMKIGDSDIEMIMYGFYKDRLEDMQIHFRSSYNFGKLKEKLSQLCGPSRKPNPFVPTYHWYGEKFSLCLTYNRISEKGVIGYTFLPIYRERQEDRKLEMVYSWLALLTDIERAVITLRFGFGREDALTVESTGQCLGLTPETIREIEAEAIKKLRKVSLKEDNDLVA